MAVILGQALLKLVIVLANEKKRNSHPFIYSSFRNTAEFKNTAGVVFSTLFTAEASPENPSTTVFHKDPYTLFFSAQQSVWWCRMVSQIVGGKLGP